MAARALDTVSLEPQIKEIGARIFAGLAEQRPHVYQKDWWQGQALQWAMRDEAFKVRLFRFVDVFPALHDSEQVARHLQEYFEQADGELPGPLRWGLRAAEPGHITAGLAAKAVAHNLAGLASRFIAGRDAQAALNVLEELRGEGLTFTLDLLGESGGAAGPGARTTAEGYLELLTHLPARIASWPVDPALDEGPGGEIPRLNISLKLTSLSAQTDPADFEGSVTSVLEKARPILRAARRHGAFVNVDLEQFRYRDLTYAVVEDLLLEDEFRDYPHAGTVVQAYLRDSGTDLERLLRLAEARGTPMTVRLVKGAYWDYETIVAGQEHWPVPVFVHKVDSDAQFERLTTLALAHPEKLRLALGTHNIRSIAHGIAATRCAGLPDSALEIQMLHGMAEPIKRVLVEMGIRVREYVPVGEPVPGMAYLVRRLLENTANESFLRQTFVEDTARDELMAKPLPTPDIRAIPPELTEVHPTSPDAPGVFVNEPHADFSRARARQAMLDGLAEARAGLGAHRPLVIGGREVDSDDVITSVNPSEPRQLIGTVASATLTQAEDAVAAASRAFPSWRDASPPARAAVLFRAADLMRRERYRLSALMVLEAGKPWREADADTTEAIDFLEYYGREALRLGRARRLDDVPGERDLLFYEPRGVAVVISPWNFPVAILAGMTSAALVAGNAVIMKPANPTPMLAWEVFRLLREAGVPDGVLAFLPGPGAQIGAFLARHPGVDLIAFTGSREVGLSIISTAAVVHPGQRNVKRVIAEMGGKNAIIVDEDADLDAAVEATVTSAFGYSGQKCSACSRAIVVGDLHDDFVSRVVAVARGLRVGDPAHPATRMGPLITRDAFEKVRGYIDLGTREASPALASAGPAAGRDFEEAGYFVGPHVFADVPPLARIAQEEIFGPVLAVIRAPDFGEALTIANGTPYALTGGVLSRSPRNIERAYREFRVGNLYVNRAITGAVVGRQPFGGSRMSGVGSKAGGPDYLLQFTDPRVVTENTVRRGFAPPDEVSDRF